MVEIILVVIMFYIKFISTTLPHVLPSFQNTDFSFFIDMGNVWGVDYDAL